MRRVVFPVVFILAALTVSAQTSTPSTLKSYAGRWQASLKGQPFFTLVLTQSGDALTGSIKHARDIHVNNKGEVDKVAADISREQVLEAKLVGEHLRIVGKDSDSQQESVYELQLLPTDKQGLLRMVRADMPSNVPTIQPWKVTRVAAKQRR